MQYSFGVSGNIIWTTHILAGIFLIYIGYMALNQHQINQLFSLLLIIMGSLVILYHSHLMYLNYNK